MRNILFIVFLFVLLHATFSAQSVSEEEKVEILSKIGEDTDISVVYDVINYKIIEAVPLLQQYYDEQDDDTKPVILEAFMELGFEGTSDYALAYFDRISSINYSDTLEEGYYYDRLVETAFVLFSLNDFSKADYIVQKDNRYRVYNDIYILMLDRLAKNPLYHEWVKNELKVYMNDDYWSYRAGAVIEYYNNFGLEALPLAKEMVINDSSANVRSNLLNNILLLIDDEEIKAFLLERMVVDEDATIRFTIARVLFETYGTPFIYKKVKEYRELENDELYYESLENLLGYFFTLPKPDSTLTVETMLDTLISYTNQCYEYEWITNRGIYNSLNKKLENAKKDLGRGKEKPAKNKLEAYQHEVEAQKDKHITEDGYKFLYYYSGYLIERL